MKQCYIMASNSTANKGAVLPSLISALSEHGKVIVIQPITSTSKEEGVYTKEEALKQYQDNPMAFYSTIAHAVQESTCDILLCNGVDIQEKTYAYDEHLSTSIPVTLSMPIIQVHDARGLSGIEAQATICARAKELQQKNIFPVITLIQNYSASNTEKESLIHEWKKEGIGELILLDNSTITSEMGKTVWEVLQKYTNDTLSPIGFEMCVIEKAKKANKTIVIPEGEDDRVIEAVSILTQQGIAKIIVLGDETIIAKKAKALGVTIDLVECIQPETSAYFEDYAQSYCELRKHKGITIEQAKETMKKNPYFGTMMVYKGHADGMVGGALHTTADTIRPSLEFIKTKDGISVVSSAFIMNIKNSLAVFADCAVNTNPDAKQLADIAISSIETARSFGINPKVAMLSYSTGTSGTGPDVTLVEEATQLVKKALPNTPIDGPIQFDAAVDSTVAKLKLPNSVVAGEANVFIFPNLSASNIGYKAVQRCANASAYGPFLQGLRKPVNDLSRGCSVNDIVITVAITAISE